MRSPEELDKPENLDTPLTEEEAKAFMTYLLNKNKPSIQKEKRCCRLILEGPLYRFRNKREHAFNFFKSTIKENIMDNLTIFDTTHIKASRQLVKDITVALRKWKGRRKQDRREGFYIWDIDATIRAKKFQARHLHIAHALLLRHHSIEELKDWDDNQLFDAINNYGIENHGPHNVNCPSTFRFRQTLKEIEQHG